MSLHHLNKIFLRGRMYYTDDKPLVNQTQFGEEISFKMVTNRPTGKDDNGNMREPKANWVFVKIRNANKIKYMKSFIDQWISNSIIEINGTLDVSDGKDGKTFYTVLVSTMEHDIHLVEKYGGPKEQQFQQQPSQGMPVAPAMAPQANPFPPTDIPGAQAPVYPQPNMSTFQTNDYAQAKQGGWQQNGQ